VVTKTGNGRSEVVKALEEKRVSVSIKAPNLETAIFEIIGNAPLVIHRFSLKAKLAILQKMEAGSSSSKGKQREKFVVENAFNEARYISKDGWDGFNASAIRSAMISACRLVNFKMTLAKMSVFCIQDGWDLKEPQVPLVRIYGKPRILEMMAWPEKGGAMMTVRPCYDEWSAKVTIRYDADQFTLPDVTNLLSRVGLQVGIGEGRPDSPKSAGMGWGTFDVKKGD
jgi:hypothetical protein